MRIRSFGCSFIFGNELHDDGRDQPYPTASNYTWPALIARRLGADYICNARGGSGNMHIADKAMMRAAQKWPDEIFIIQWSFIDRFDWLRQDDHTHHANNNGWTSVMPGSNNVEAAHWYRHFHTQLFDQYRSLIQASATVNMLQSLGQRFIMCYVDPLMFERRFPLPLTVSTLQEQLWPHMLDFEGDDFVHWSRKRGFTISDIGHPLEDAHAAAADLMFPYIERLLK